MESGQDAPPTGGRACVLHNFRRAVGIGRSLLPGRGESVPWNRGKMPLPREVGRVSYKISVARSGSGDPSYR